MDMYFTKLEKGCFTTVLLVVLGFWIAGMNSCHYHTTAISVGNEIRYCQIDKVRLDSGKYPTIILDVTDTEANAQYEVDTNSREIPDPVNVEAIVIAQDWKYRDGVVKRVYVFEAYRTKK